MSSAISLSEAGPLTEEQRALAQTVREVVARRADSAAVRAATETELGYDTALWQVLCEQIGVAALSIPEEYDGIGVGYLETHLVLGELARNLVPSPLLGSVVLGAQAVLAGGDAEACARLLPDVAAGAANLGLCWAGERGGWTASGLPVTASADAGETTVDGTAHYVIGGHYADTFIVVAAAASGPVLVEVPADAAGVEVEVTAAMDPTRPLARVAFSGATGTVIGAGAETVERVRAIALTALSAEAVGAAEHLLELTVEYTGQRKQFGRVIGSFQALKHRMADLYVLVETSRSIALAAAESLSATAAATAKAYSAESFETVAGEAIQLHGGIAITWEHDAHLYFKRAHGTAQLFGQPHELLTGLEAAAGL